MCMLLVVGCTTSKINPAVNQDPLIGAMDLVDLESPLPQSDDLDSKEKTKLVDGVISDNSKENSNSVDSSSKLDKKVYLDKKIQSLQEATSKVKSYYFYYTGETLGNDVDTKSKMSHFYVYGNAVRIEIPYEQNYFPEDVFDVVYLDKANKKAYAWCEDLDYCAKMDELKEISYYNYNVELPVEITQNLKCGTVIGKQQIEMSKEALIVECDFGDYKLRYWLYDYNGAVLRKEYVFEDGMKTIFDFDNMVFNNLKKEKVFPHLDIRPEGFAEYSEPVVQSIEDKQQEAVNELANEQLDSEKIDENNKVSQSITTVKDVENCKSVEGQMSITQDTVLCPGEYVLRQGIIISESDITLDCNGAVLMGSPHDYLTADIIGIGMRSDARNVNIVNCVVKNFGIGVKISTDSNLLTHNTITENTVGILMEQIDYPYYHEFIVDENILSENNIFNNTRELGKSGQSFDIIADTLRDVIANQNYWGNTDCNKLKKIYDNHAVIRDNYQKGTFKHIITNTILTEQFENPTSKIIKCE
ncbi:hypothetical protein HOK51_03355 [Candidatus Woesearchaeota archaeon]|nr:hypothetical protein [Candidatus Woesearchaeota archaeon]MBT6518857.1 hypothetical protein [Candidatus Woesearchaeota archaeon]MBT7367996.1 hypothetical protein [Candidatus Woesearchaeota archaeon]